MFELRTKNLIVNVADGNVNVDGGVSSFKGFDTISTDKISAVKMARAQDPKVQINTYAITAPGKTGEAIFYVKATNSRSQAEYHWDKLQFGKRFPISVSIDSGDLEADIKTKLVAAIASQNSKYNDLPFTATTTNMTGKAGGESISWEADGAVITLADGSVEKVAWSTTVTQANSVGLGLGKQLEENVSMLMPSRGVVSAEKADEKPIIGAKYTEVAFKVAFDSDSVAAPGYVGEVNQSGEYEVCIYINESQLSNTEIDELFTELFSVANYEAVKADGTAPTGADLTLKQDDFLA